MSHREIVPSVSAIVQDVYDQNTGTSDKGDWAIQNIFVSQNGQKIKVKLCDQAPISRTAKGKAILISCKEGQKGLSGVYAEDDEYRGKTSRIIKVTASGIVEVDGTAAPLSQAQSAPNRPVSGRTAPADNDRELAERGLAPVQPRTNGNGHADKVRDAAKVRARDYYRVLEAVQEMRQAWDGKHPHAQMTDGHFQAACASVFIKLDRDGVFN